MAARTFPAREPEANERYRCSTAPGTPSNLTIVSASGGTVVLSWTAAAGNPTSYVVEAGSRSGGVDLANTDLGSPAASLTSAGVPAGTYYVRIRGRNACGLGSASNEVVIAIGSGARSSL